jgi:hypothetical protein
LPYLKDSGKGRVMKPHKEIGRDGFGRDFHGG